RKDMGYIPLVTPTSQIVGTQAVLNVLMGERYKTTPDETRNLFAGKYGRTPAPVDREIQKKILGEDAEIITDRPANHIPLEFDDLKSQVEGKARHDEDVLSYALFPKVWLEFHENVILGRAEPESPPQVPEPEMAASEAPP